MSIWTSKVRPRTALALALALGGCLADGGGSAPGRVSVAGDSVVIAGPQGFCVDPAGSRTSGPGAFVLLGSCASISGSALAPRPADVAVLTATVSAGDSGASIAGAGAELAAYFASQDGRAALSRTGDAESVEVIDAAEQEGGFVLHARTRMADTASDTWRALFDLNGRIVTLSVLTLPGNALDDATGRALLARFMAQVRKASPVIAPPPQE